MEVWNDFQARTLILKSSEMEGDNGDDPYGSLIGFCQISASQEDLLKLCPFAGKTDLEDGSESSDSSELGVESTGIVIVSLPESLEANDNSPRDEYHTPPEGSAMASSDGQRSAVAVDDDTFDTETVLYDGRWMDGGQAVDLGRDTDVGFSSEVQLSQKSDHSTSVDRPVALEENIFEKEIDNLEPEKLGFPANEFCLGKAMTELTRNELKVIEHVVGMEFPSFSTETTTNETSEVVMKVFNNLENVCAAQPDQALEIHEEMLVTEVKKSGEKSLNFPGELGESNSLTETEIIGSVDLNDNSTNTEFSETLEVDLEMEEEELKKVENGVEDNRGCNHGEDNMDYTDKCIVEDNTQSNGRAGMSKPLPPLMKGVKRKAPDESNSEADRDVTILDVLKILKGEEGCKCDDDNGQNLSVLDILMRRGMTFPRPSWWPEGGFCWSRSRFV